MGRPSRHPPRLPARCLNGKEEAVGRARRLHIVDDRLAVDHCDALRRRSPSRRSRSAPSRFGTMRSLDHLLSDVGHTFILDGFARPASKAPEVVIRARKSAGGEPPGPAPGPGAIARMAQLSLAIATFLRMLTRFWMRLSSAMVAFWFRGAIFAPTLVLTAVLPFRSGSISGLLAAEPAPICALPPQRSPSRARGRAQQHQIPVRSPDVRNGGSPGQRANLPGVRPQGRQRSPGTERDPA